MNKSIVIEKEADAKKASSSTHESDERIHRARNESERQLGSLSGVIGNISRNGAAPSAESIAMQMSGMHMVQRAPALLALQQTHGNRYVQRVVAGIQAKLTVGHPGDIYEQEADRVADEVMRMPDPRVQRQVGPEEEEEEELIQTKPLAEEITPLVQRQVEPEEEEIRTKQLPGQTREIVPDVETRINSIKGGGLPLPDSTKAFFEPRFGCDFSQVRVHADAKAADTARAVNARAFTRGHDVVFGAGQYAPGTTAGQRLLAHELTHAVQQGRAPRLGTARTQRKSTIYSEADTAAESVFAGRSAVVNSGVLASLAPQLQFYVDTICGRPSTQFDDFPGTYISQIDIDLTSPNHHVTLTWAGPNASAGSKGPFRSSPGAGRCNLDCDNTATSQTDDSLCTPKGTRQVEGYACALSDSRATNATFFHQTRGIALHYFPTVPKYPASHGCVRLESLHAARLIYDNSRKDMTTVNVTGTWAGIRCYDNNGDLIRR